MPCFQILGRLTAQVSRTAMLLTAFVCIAASAQQFPSKSLRLVVPFPAGGAADAVARLVAQSMSQGLSQQVLIDNRPGADGMIAGAEVSKAPPDGHTLLFGTNSGFSAAPFMHRSIPYDPMADFAPIGKVGEFGFFVFVNDAVPARTLTQLFEYARANSGRLAYGTNGTMASVAMAQLSLRANARMTHVPYKGDAPLTLDLLAGRVHMALATGALFPHANNGKLRILATLLPARTPIFPDVPTLAESGFGTVPMTSWGGLFAPAKTPRPVVERLSRELARALATPEVLESLDKLAFAAQGSTPEGMALIVKQQLEVWRKAVKDAGLALE